MPTHRVPMGDDQALDGLLLALRRQGVYPEAVVVDQTTGEWVVVVVPHADRREVRA